MKLNLSMIHRISHVTGLEENQEKVTSTCLGVPLKFTGDPYDAPNINPHAIHWLKLWRFIFLASPFPSAALPPDHFYNGYQ